MREPIEQRGHRGFTLVELAVVIAILGTLAALVIPNWASTARNKKYDPEITAMFAEISTREELYKADFGNGAYLAEAECPSSPIPAGADFNVTCVGTTPVWAQLRVVPTDTSIRCTYEVTTGLPGFSPAPPAPCVAPANMGTVGWYYMIARCNMDDDASTPEAMFCAASWDTTQRKLNYGQ